MHTLTVLAALILAAVPVLALLVVVDLCSGGFTPHEERDL